MKKGEHVEGSSAGYTGSENPIKRYSLKNGPVIDLGFARSPLGPAPELLSALEQATQRINQGLSEYPSDPYNTKTKQIVLNGIGINGISTEGVILGYDAGDELVRYLSHRGFDTILAPAYSFPNVSQLAIRHGTKYQPLSTETLDPLTSLASVLQMKEKNLHNKIIYIDYPNNPTGVVNGELVRNVIAHVSQNGGLPFVDLAFGEVLGEEFRDIIQFTLDHGGVTLGSLSKTQGLPGLRTSYAFLSQNLADLYSKDEIPAFRLSRQAEVACELLFQPQSNGRTLAQVQAGRAAEYNMDVNQILEEGLNALGLRLAPSDRRSPIQVVISDDPNFYEKLAEQGVATESLADYGITLSTRRSRKGKGYGNAAVRLLTPQREQVEEVLRRFQLVLSK